MYDIKQEKLLDMKECARILGLKYHTARQHLLKANLGFVLFGTKKLWIESDILQLKQKHYVEPQTI